MQRNFIAFILLSVFILAGWFWVVTTLSPSKKKAPEEKPIAQAKDKAPKVEDKQKEKKVEEKKEKKTEEKKAEEKKPAAKKEEKKPEEKKGPAIIPVKE